ncbi:hypothetical protein HYPSUDRAFT_91044 [Hypholoma sublateritium FD-334 SS-4]|uniref:Uncharacterized protein n=1 Tax=Hypholoma sublateritium (strain FD-334 SS-4) TaxID=945553 RepID=A0A0D2M0S4_HYPSF|nr:hypothetical protein HYPSUDRAFT_91044 [Hypholoma sublateritium FD-334 SS-4]
MNASVTLPFDIFAYISDTLGAGREKVTLKALSRTCKFMLPLCRRHLFSSIGLMDSTWATQKNIGLARFLTGSPDTVRCINKLSYFVDTRTPLSQHIIDILEVLRSRSASLQSVSLLPMTGEYDWN